MNNDVEPDPDLSGNSRENNTTIDNIFESTTFAETTNTTIWIENDFYRHDPCYLYGSCEFVSGMPTNLRFCHCDNICSIYGDCCIDAGVHLDSKMRDTKYNCHRSMFHLVFKYVGIYVIDECHFSYNNTEIRRKCLQNLARGGPFVSDQHGTVFKNQFCAECNYADNISFFELKLSNINVNFVTQSPLKLEHWLSLPNVNYKMSPPRDIPLRSCAVLDDPTDVNHNCDVYQINPHLDFFEGKTSRIYRNYLCPSMEGYDYVSCYGKYIDDHELTYSPRALTVMFSFSSNKQLPCWEIGELCYGEPILQYHRTDLHLRLDTEIKMSSSFLDAVLFILLDALSVPLLISVKNGQARNVSEEANMSSYQVDMTLQLEKDFPITQIIIFEHMFNEFTLRANIRFNKSNETKTIDVVSLKQQLSDNFPVVWIYNSYDQFRTVPPDQMEIQYNSGTMWDSFCSNIIMNCSTEGNYIKVEDVECLTTNKTARVDLFYTKAFITYVGCSLSIFTLLVSIILSRKLHIFSSVTGNNFENMSVSLCLSNLLFMLGIGLQDYQLLCYITGIILHYLWLCCFSFMSIATICIRKGITSLRVSAITVDKTGTRCLLSLTGLFIPFLFVVPSIIFDLLDVPGFHADYAGTVCFPTGFLTNTLLFSCPIILSIVINLLSLIQIIWYIARHNKEIESIRKSGLDRHAQVYLRVCSFTGVFWITGIFGSFFKSDVIDYIFIVLCSFQGMTVAIANLTTKAVFRGLVKTKNVGFNVKN